MGLTIDANRYYNLIRKEQSYSLSPQEEALMLLHYLESRNVHVVVDEQYVLDERGDKKDRVIVCIVWWTLEQIRMARRFVSDMIAETDATFNTNEKRLLLQSFVGIDNTNSTFQFLQAFSTAESAHNIRFILQVLQDHFFYDCPGFAVLAGDFGSGLSAGFAQKAAQDARDQEKQLAQKGKQTQWGNIPNKLQLDHNLLPTTAQPQPKSEDIDDRQQQQAAIGNQFEQENVPNELQLDYNPLPTAALTRPNYEPDSQTIVVDTDWVRAVEPTVIGINQESVILQFCTWHGAEAIKRRLIAKGYTKERREQLNHLIWAWIKAPNLGTLDDARNELILNLNTNEKEYLVGWYQPREPQFCHAYTCQYRNLGVHSTQRVEGNHPILTSNLHKNLSISEAVFRICNRLDSLTEDYEERLSRSRISEPRLIDVTFFQLVLRRVTHYCLELCGVELLQAKELYDIEVSGGEYNGFDPKVGCEELCQLPLRYRLPCRHWMLHFYRKNEPIPINLFHPRWLIDGPSVLHEPWHIRLNNYDYTRDKRTEDHYTRDRSTRAGEQLIIDTSLALVEKHKNLPPGEKETFALAFKKLSDSLADHQDQKLERLQAIPRRLPDPIIQPKVSFVPRRKRALTGREVAELQEKEEARQRHRAQNEAAKQSQNDAQQEQYTRIRSKFQTEVADTYTKSHDVTKSHNIIDISSDGSDTSESNNGSEEQSIAPLSLLIRPTRERKPTSKQASQNRRTIKKEQKKLARLARKPKTIDTTQLDQFELPFYSS